MWHGLAWTNSLQGDIIRLAIVNRWQPSRGWVRFLPFQNCFCMRGVEEGEEQMRLIQGVLSGGDAVQAISTN